MSNITITVSAPELVAVLEKLVGVLSSDPVTKPEAAKLEPANVVKPEPTGIDKPTELSIEDVRSLLMQLKQQKGAPAVREILNAFGVKSVPDIPEAIFKDVIKIANEKLGV